MGSSGRARPKQQSTRSRRRRSVKAAIVPATATKPRPPRRREARAGVVDAAGTSAGSTSTATNAASRPGLRPRDGRRRAIPSENADMKELIQLAKDVQKELEKNPDPKSRKLKFFAVLDLSMTDKSKIRRHQIEELLKALHNNPDLQTIMMHGWNLDDALFAQVCRLIESCPNVSSFNAGENDQLTDEAGKSFLELLERSGRCIGLYIKEKQLSAATHARIAEVLSTRWRLLSGEEKAVVSRGKPAPCFWRE